MGIQSEDAGKDIFELMREAGFQSPHDGGGIEVVGPVLIKDEVVPHAYMVKSDNPDQFLYSIRELTKLLATLEDYKNQLSSMSNVVKIMSEKNVSEPAESVRELLVKYDKLKADSDAEIFALKEEIDLLTAKIHNLKYRTDNCNKARTASSRKFAAKVISMAVQGYSVDSIHAQVSAEMEKAPSKATVYRALSVADAGDRERILSIYSSNRDEFDGLFMEDVIVWFEAARKKKLGLVSIETLCEDYGSDRVQAYLREHGFRPDKYVDGEYYQSCEFKNIGRRRRKVESVAPGESNEQVNDTW